MLQVSGLRPLRGPTASHKATKSIDDPLALRKRSLKQKN